MVTAQQSNSKVNCEILLRLRGFCKKLSLVSMQKRRRSIANYLNFCYLFGGTALIVYDDDTRSTSSKQLSNKTKEQLDLEAIMNTDFGDGEIFTTSSSDSSMVERANSFDPISIIASDKTASLSAKDPLSIIVDQEKLSKLWAATKNKERSHGSTLSTENPSVSVSIETKERVLEESLDKITSVDSPLINRIEKMETSSAPSIPTEVPLPLEEKVEFSANFKNLFNIDFSYFNSYNVSVPSAVEDLNLKCTAMVDSIFSTIKTKSSRLTQSLRSCYNPQLAADYYDKKRVVDHRKQDPQSFFEWLFDFCSGNWVLFLKLLIFFGLLMLFLAFFKSFYNFFRLMFKRKPPAVGFVPKEQPAFIKKIFSKTLNLPIKKPQAWYVIWYNKIVQLVRPVRYYEANYLRFANSRRNFLRFFLQIISEFKTKTDK